MKSSAVMLSLSVSVCIFFAFPIFSQEVSIPQMIGINNLLLQEGLFTGSKFDIVFSDNKVLGFNSQVINKHWTPYLADERISESTFYEIAGLPDISLKAKKHHDNAIITILAGSFPTAIGLFICGFSTVVENNEMVPIIIGGTISLCGVITTGIGIRNITTPMTSSDFAQTAVEKFNYELIIKYLE